MRRILATICLLQVAFVAKTTCNRYFFCATYVEECGSSFPKKSMLAEFVLRETRTLPPAMA